jgi:DNA-3-methyladenine glycosylase
MNTCENESIKNILDIDFYARDTSVVAEELIGKLLVRQYKGNKSAIVLSGIITETEAYYGSDDPASHAYRGITQRSKIMFGRPGIAYVYFCYGMHYMLNAVTEKTGVPGAVLIRAARPVSGMEIMMDNRQVRKKRIIADGPGKLTQAFGIDLKDNGKDLTMESSCLKIYNYAIGTANIKVKRSYRIGLSKGNDRQLRFMIEDKY